jgi:hypothetical protein
MVMAPTTFAQTIATPRRALSRTRSIGVRRGFALMDAVIAGILLAIGMVAVLSVAGQALALARRGEIDVRAAAALDELLAMVLTEGPRDFPDIHATSGTFEEGSPFADFSYTVRIDQGGSGVPAEIEAIVVHDTGRTYTVKTRIAEKRGEEPDPVRAPAEPIDRATRIEEKEARRENR